WPHGILFRDAESEMRKKMIESDVVECVIGLGPNLFYNSPMEACLLITTTNKKKERKGKILFINAVNEVKQEKSIAYLEEEHIQKIFNAYKDFKDINDFCRVVNQDEILNKNGSLNISLYVSKLSNGNNHSGIDALYKKWKQSSTELSESMNELFNTLGIK
ncbi:MAG TPA: N-6 DNA methylase, partial [Ignavibacteriaceae bacterium]|nr:N-6 DNA methylase [Ignavibacteriaceae bacterium]